MIEAKYIPKNRTLPTAFTWVLLLLAALSLGACSRSSSGPEDGPIGGPVTASGKASADASGATLFAQNCQRCHGPNATGSNFGPPLVHKIYEPNHHPDAAFYRAAQAGVRAHHWQFGNMPRVANVNNEQVSKIIAYIRQLQRDAGIH